MGLHEQVELPGKAVAMHGRGIVAVSANSSWALFNYRIGLLSAIQDAGYDVVALIPEDNGVSRLRSAGVEVRSISIEPHGTSVGSELRLLRQYLRILRELRPIALLGFTIKPNIYGALAGRFAGVPVINNVTGLGLVFAESGPLRTLVGALYRFAFRRSHRVFFQNRESRDFFVARRFVRPEQAELLPGSGIDLEQFAPQPARKDTKTNFKFLLASRMIWHKGVREYCEAARWFRANYPEVRFQLLGAVEPRSNSAAIPRKQIDEWQKEGVEYLGATEDIRPFFRAADCIVLPSYYPEGVPRALIEAAALGKPIITTDTPGCRDTVDHGQTGFVCAPRSVDSLIAAMLQIIRLPDEQRVLMGSRGRKKAERDFDERLVINAYLAEIDAIVSR